MKAGLQRVLVLTAFLFFSTDLVAKEAAPILRFESLPPALRLESGQGKLALDKTDQVVVVVAYGVGCPVMRQNIPGFLDLERGFEKTARFVYIDGNPQDTDEKIRDEAKMYGLEGRIGLDRDQKWLQTFGLGTVGEATVVQ